MTARQALAAMMLKDVLDAMRRSNDRRRELTETIDNHIQKADGRHEELKIQMMELQKSCGAQTVKDSMEKYFETHRAVTTLVPNENKVGMLITRLVAIDKKCVENENKAAAHQTSFGEVLKCMSADAATEKQKAAKRPGMLFNRLESIDIKIIEN